jgi:hypothetical protein
MVQKVTGYKAEDGKVFDTEALALAHEKFLSLGAAVKAALTGLGFGAAMVYPAAPHDDGSLNLEDFLLNNSEALIEALTPPKKERKPRAPKDPVEPSKPLAEALTTIGGANAVNGAVAVTTLELKTETPAEVAPVNVEAGNEAEDELAALLGGEASATTSSEVAV